MVASERAPKWATQTSTVRRRIAAVVALLAALAAGVVVAPPAGATPVDTNWSTTNGPAGTFTDLSNGSATPAAMSYSMPSAGLGVTRSWDFTATAATAGQVKVPYTWQGLHAWFQVRTQLDAIVIPANGVLPVQVNNLVSQGPAVCCTAPSNGFVYGGVATFDVQAGDRYGFRLSGSNSDINNFLRGTLTLSTKPFLDATLGDDNRDWIKAEDITAAPAPASTRLIKTAGEARWFKFRVSPDQDVKATLQGLTGTDNLPADYDIALYGDIQQAFDQIVSGDDIAQLAASSASTGVTDTQVPSFPPVTSSIPTKASPPTGQQFAPRVYAPRVYAPRVYAPRVYAPRVYAPRVYAPRVYAPGSYVPDNVDSSLSDAYSAAQNQVLVAASTNTGKLDEVASGYTGSTTGWFYIKVQGHDDGAFDSATPFQVTGTATVSNAACVGLQPVPKDPNDAAPAVNSQQTVIVTDTNRLGVTGTAKTSYLDSLGKLAGATSGVVVDVGGSTQVQGLWDQVDGHKGCPQAVNMVADAIKSIVDSRRNANSQYVVIAGGDDVIPFFRYPDTSGLGPESQFSPPLLPTTPAGASLLSDQVQSQDAYGSNTTVTIGGVTVPLPDLAVGRLVKTPAEITGVIDNFVDDIHGVLPSPNSSLVTGYDFLADAADAVNNEFTAALPAAGATTDALITHPNKTPAETPWSASDLSTKLLGSHHDVVYLAGHFSANDTLAADFTTAFAADDLGLAANANKLRNTLVLSAGCHSGYSIVDGAAVPPSNAGPGTNPFDWTQRLAQQKAVLIGGTGYQYGDTDFLEYSERLYLDVAQRLHQNTGTPGPIAVGKALVLGKQDYLAGLTTLSGIDQKAMLEATLYGLPMTGFDAPRRTALPTGTNSISTTPVAAGTAGAAFGLSTATFTASPIGNATKQKTVVGGTSSYDLTWLQGTDGVTIQPGVPALPKKVADVTVQGKVLRGVGFRSGTYKQTSGTYPLTGAPAIEGSTPNSTFESDTFFPQRLSTVNYFGALRGNGRTTLVLNPGQYRTEPKPTGVSDDDWVPTNTLRDYTSLGMQLFYAPTGLSVPAGQSDPTLAAPPGISEVRGTASGGVVTFSTRVTGDPSAGVQKVWVTWTSGPDASTGLGAWDSVDLVQDPNDSTRWTGTLPLAQGQAFGDIRFLVQAVNGVGALSLDSADGDGYQVREQTNDVVTLTTVPRTDALPFGVTAVVKNGQGQSLAGRTVSFTVSRGGTGLFSYAATSDANGQVVLRTNGAAPVPWGNPLQIEAFLYDLDGQVQSTATTQVTVDQRLLTVTPTSLTALAGAQYASRLTATVKTSGNVAVNGAKVVFTTPASDPTAVFVGAADPHRVTVTTNASGVAQSPFIRAGTVPGAFALTVGTDGADLVTVPMLAQYGVTSFGSPATESKVNNLSTTNTLPLKLTVLGADGKAISDAEAAALLQSGQAQVRWREVGKTTWTTIPGLLVYLPDKDQFQADMKASYLGVKGKTFDVQIRVVPGPVTDPGAALQSDVNLGSRSLQILIK
jgi:hypothetical protein